MTGDLPSEARERILDEEHLRLLSIGHYIVGGLILGVSTLFIFYCFFFLLIAQRPDLFNGSSNSPPPPGAMMFVALFFGLFVLAGWGFGTLIIYIGRCIKRRVRRGLTLVVASLSTLSIPLGTILGVLTLMVLTRPQVKRLYDEALPAASSGPPVVPQ
jgi:hypothetical protein